MLQNLRTGIPGILLITDTVPNSGRDLLNCFVLAALQREEQVHVFGFELSQEDFVSAFPEEPLSRLTFHDGFSDPLHWGEAHPSFTKEDFTLHGIMKRVGDVDQPVTIVLDSLSWLVARCPLSAVCHTLRALPHLKQRAGCMDTRVLALLHTDLHAPGVLSSVCSMADTVVSMMERGERDCVSVTQRRKTGKTISCREEIRIHQSLSLEILIHQESEHKTTKAVDPTANLTFNLRLSDTERELKESTALPYVFTAGEKSSLLQASSSSSKIFYDPDPEDDIDDEDPDDDLDV
ncbi:elongator complex protein 5 [Pelodytes ibericus]